MELKYVRITAHLTNIKCQEKPMKQGIQIHIHKIVTRYEIRIKFNIREHAL